jgi:hypothetical protein
MSFLQPILDPANIGGGLSGQTAANASLSAAQMQTQAANHAADLQNQQFSQLQANLSPYMQLGSSSIGNLQALLNGGSLNTKFSGPQWNPTEQQLQSTPGYQFALTQGLKGVDNSLSAKGLNLSGAQAKGISAYSTGLADQTYQQQFQNYQTQYQNALQQFQTNYGVSADQYGRLSNLVNLGQNSAAGVGQAGMTNATNVGNTLMSGANAGAAGQVGAANATTQGSQNLLGAGLAALAFLA